MFIWRNGQLLVAVVLAFLCGCHSPGESGELAVRSPDGTIAARVQVQRALAYSVEIDGQRVVNDSRLGLSLSQPAGEKLGADAKLTHVERRSHDQTWENRFGKRRQVRDHYNEMRLRFSEKSGRIFEVIFRAYDDGVAFRYVVPAESGLTTFTVDRELTEFAFAGDYPCFAGEDDKGRQFRGPQEWQFKPRHLSEITTNVAGLPLLVQTPAAWIALTEADLVDWAGMWMGDAEAVGAGVTLKAKLAPRRDGDGLVKARAPHDSPWRVLMIGRQPGRLIESDLVFNLATPCELADISWVQPGKSAWDHWWSGDTKMDTATIEEYIQLAADMGWPYQQIDWMWYGKPGTPKSDITKVSPALDMPAVLRFAAERHVRLWLYLSWRDVERNDAYKKAFALYEQWGIAGVKIDGMESDDQYIINWCEKVSREAAAHHLMVNFHGNSKPTGQNRTLPNEITCEGVMGNEWNKWSALVTPEHKLTLPFTRFLAGPGDFTPGGFLNRQPADFKIIPTATEVQGTRCEQLALTVLFDSPIECLCDSPANYRGQPGADFLKIVPTVWDETRVLDGVVAQHLVMARRFGNEWYLGAATDHKERQIPIRLDFLGPGKWTMSLWSDAPDSRVNAEHLQTETRTVTAGDTLDLRLAPNGGAVARFVR
ncbi:MAG TPA: glycoside hydrolase family 97 protein [Verrucomicrobiae bacterium]|nr:glycoside hydrolase family 97 protein [Verrucomicrobiae bacterium]